MNKRLAWNFEINSDNLLNLHYLDDIKEDIRWESRYFWPEKVIITLHGLTDDFLMLSNYELKHREDSYSLLPDCHYNIKQRRGQLLYKPLLEEAPMMYGYGKKINLADYPANELLPGTDTVYASKLLTQLHTSQQEIDVVKEALIYKFPSNPTIKLELARLQIAEKIYFSACVEGRSQLLVRTITKHLLGEQISCDYVSFLKQALAL